MTSETARTIVAYGKSGNYKSTNALFFARWMYQTYHRPVRLVSVESSSQTIFEPAIAAGIVIPFYMIKAKNPLPAFRRLARGEWPVQHGDEYKWEPTDFQGGLDGPEAPCGYIWEGLASTSELLLEDCREKARAIGQDVVGKFEEEGEKFAKAAPSHYDFVQMEVIRLLKGFSSLPIERLLVTSHEAIGEEQDTRAPIRGPGLVGKARTEAVQKWCGTLLHFEDYPTVETDPKTKLGVTRIRVRAWYQRHPDANFPNISYPAKITIPPSKLESLWKAFPGGYFEPTVTEGLDKFLVVEQQLLAEAAKELTEWKAKHEAVAK